MFTGLVVETGELIAMERADASARLTLRAPGLSATAALGDSIAVNGCCLTVARREGETLGFDLLAETLQRTNLGDLESGTTVNLEPALSASGQLGGHFVQGHVDTAAKVIALEAKGEDHRLEIELPSSLAPYLVEKGSIAVDGISLTVAELKPASFVCWIIPHTMQHTNLQNQRAGHRVNLEGDMLAKYVERILSLRK